jgi:hypothetical protein
LALGADEIVCGPIAELSPIDPITYAVINTTGEAPAAISSEDIRMFGEMATRWFGLASEEARVEALKALTQRIFPTTISSIYRSEKYVEFLAVDLLKYNRPKSSRKSLHLIARKLIRGFESHLHSITPQDAASLGLNTRIATAEEERILESLTKKCHHFVNSTVNNGEAINALLIAPKCAFGRLTTPRLPDQTSTGDAEKTNRVTIPVMQWRPLT